MIDWNTIQSTKQIDRILERSKSIPCLIFKHSTTCPISSMAKYRLEGDWSFSKEELEPYYLDLLSFRNISNQIAETFEVHHESPQVLVIRNGHCVYDASHLGITVDELKECYQDTF